MKLEDTFEEKIMKFKNDVSHHAKEEETKLLPKVKKLIEDKELKKLGKKMADFKKEFDHKKAIKNHETYHELTDMNNEELAAWP